MDLIGFDGDINDSTWPGKYAALVDSSYPYVNQVRERLLSALGWHIHRVLDNSQSGLRTRFPNIV